MTVWLLRHAPLRNAPQEGDYISLADFAPAELLQAPNRTGLRAALRAQSPEESPEAIERLTQDYWQLIDGFHPEDLLVVPSKTGVLQGFEIRRLGHDEAGAPTLCVMPVGVVSPRRLDMSPFERAISQRPATVASGPFAEALRARLKRGKPLRARIMLWLLGIILFLNLIRLIIAELNKDGIL